MGQAAARDEDNKIGLNTVIMAGLERGLTMQDIKNMQIGHVVDFTVDYNRRQKDAEEKAERKSKAKHYRLATKDEVSAWTKG